MAFFFANYVTIGFFSILLLFCFKCYLDYKKKIAGFPYLNTWSYILHCQVNGKITQDSPLNVVLFEKLVQTGKKYMKEGLFMTFWSRPVLFIYNQDAVKFFTNQKAAKEKPLEYQMVEDVIGAGLVTSNGERFRAHKKLINPAFNLGTLTKKIPLFNEHAMALVKDMENQLAGKPCVTIIEILKRHCFTSFCESILGLKQNEENIAKSQRILENVEVLSNMTVQRMVCPWLRPKFALYLFPSGRKFYKNLKEWNDFVSEIILNMKKNVSSNKNMDEDQFGTHLSKSFTYLLLNHHLNDPTFTIEDLHSEVMTIICAGFDTTSYTTMWCLFLLGSHPEVQEKAYSEIQLKTSDYLTLDECNSLTYLEAVIKETLRLYPTLPMYYRTLSEDVQYENYKVFKGTTIAFFPHVSHRNPKLYPDPEHFRPERFLCGELKTAMSYIPFAEGSRSCIGKNYAMLEIKIFLAHILRNFKIISLDKKEDVKLYWSLIASSSIPLRMQIMQRSS